MKCIRRTIDVIRIQFVPHFYKKRDFHQECVSSPKSAFKFLLYTVYYHLLSIIKILPCQTLQIQTRICLSMYTHVRVGFLPVNIIKIVKVHVKKMTIRAHFQNCL